MPDVEAFPPSPLLAPALPPTGPAVPVGATEGPAVDVGLHSACERLGGIYQASEDGGQSCRVPPAGAVPALFAPLVVPASVAFEVRPSVVVED